jgi:multiple sugar transport system permease protein
VHALLKRHPGFIFTLFFPTAALIAAFLAYPLVNGFRLSFTDASPLNPVEHWIGLENYQYLLEDPAFWEIVANSFGIVIAAVMVAGVFGLAIALILNGNIRGRPLLRTLVFQVWVVPWITVAVLWGWLFSHEFGVINQVLIALGVLSEPINWLVRPGWARFAIVCGFVWRITPFMMVMALAALQAVPKEIIEAATVDGASYWRRFQYIVLPLLRNVMAIAALLQCIRLFQEVTLPWVLTKGGPDNATTTLSLFLYKTAFQQWDFGLASAIGALWTVAILVIAVLYVRLLVPRR